MHVTSNDSKRQKIIGDIFLAPTYSESSLPNEIWQKVFNYLPLNDFKNVRLTSKIFYLNCHDVIVLRAKKLHFNTDKINKVSTQRLLQYIASVNRLKIYLRLIPAEQIEELDKNKKNEYTISPLSRVLVLDENRKIHIQKTLKNIIYLDQPQQWEFLSDLVVDRDSEDLRQIINKIYLLSKIKFLKVENDENIKYLISALGTAPANDLLGVVKKILKLGVDINCRGSFYHYEPNKVGSDTPLIFASRFSKLRSILYLLSKGANPQLHSNFGSTPLHWILHNQNENEIEREHEVDPLSDDDLFTVVSQFLLNGAKVDVEDEDGDIPLFQACKMNRPYIFKLLFFFANNFDINFQNAVEQTLLHVSKDVETTQFILERNPDINIQDEEGKTPLMIALESGNFEKARLLVTHRDFNPNLRDNAGKSSLSYAEEKSKHEGFGELIDLITEREVSSFMSDE